MHCSVLITYQRGESSAETQRYQILLCACPALHGPMQLHMLQAMREPPLLKVGNYKSFTYSIPHDPMQQHRVLQAMQGPNLLKLGNNILFAPIQHCATQCSSVLQAAQRPVLLKLSRHILL